MRSQTVDKQSKRFERNSSPYQRQTEFTSICLFADPLGRSRTRLATRVRREITLQNFAKQRWTTYVVLPTYTTAAACIPLVTAIFSVVGAFDSRSPILIGNGLQGRDLKLTKPTSTAEIIGRRVALLPRFEVRCLFSS